MRDLDVESQDHDARKQAYTLLQSLDGEWIKLPLAVMQDVGPAVQTLGGILKVTTKQTFAPLSDIALASRVPIKTARNHIQMLDQCGWVVNRGREHTRSGRPRRTCTLAVTAKTTKAIEPYGVLPWWACCSIRRVGKLPWAARGVLSVVLGRLMSLKAAVDRTGEVDGIEEEIVGAIDNLGGDDRFAFSLDWLGRQTGLTHDSVTTAKQHLHKLRILDWQGRERDDGGTATDLLVPNWRFRVIVTPASEGRCWLDFQGDAKSGQYPREKWAIPHAKTGHRPHAKSG